MGKPRFDAAEVITQEIIGILEAGVMPWRKPWVGGGSGVPLRHSGEAYRGINTFLLSMRAIMAGHSSPYWMTMRQANEMDARIRKGETSSLVVYYGQSHKDAARDASKGESDTETDGESYRFLKSYRVFNASQIEGLPDHYFPTPEERALPGAEEIPALEAYFSAIGADVVRTGTQACYVPSKDRIYMPEICRFADAEKFYAVMAHEHAHLSGSKDRLNREFGGKFGDGNYAKEELVAEIAASIICRQLGMAPYHIDDSASYISSWIKILSDDHRFLFKAGAHAQRAADWLNAAAAKGGWSGEIAAPMAEAA